MNSTLGLGKTAVSPGLPPRFQGVASGRDGRQPLNAPPWQADAEQLMAWLDPPDTRRASIRPETSTAARVLRRHGLPEDGDTPRPPQREERRPIGVADALAQSIMPIAEGFASIADGLAGLFDWSGRRAGRRAQAEEDMRALGEMQAVLRGRRPVKSDGPVIEDIGLSARAWLAAEAGIVPQLMRTAHEEGKGAGLLAMNYFQVALRMRSDGQAVVVNREALLKGAQWRVIASRLGEETGPLHIPSDRYTPEAKSFRLDLTPEEIQHVAACVEHWFRHYPKNARPEA